MAVIITFLYSNESYEIVGIKLIMVKNSLKWFLKGDDLKINSVSWDWWFWMDISYYCLFI